MLRLVRARCPSTDRTEIASPRVFSQRELAASSFGSRLASSHRPNRVSYRTDEWFTSCCSPPRVATTQLQSITSYVDLERTCTPPTRCALRRTAMAILAMPRHGRDADKSGQVARGTPQAGRREPNVAHPDGLRERSFGVRVACYRFFAQPACWLGRVVAENNSRTGRDSCWRFSFPQASLRGGKR